MMWPFPQELGVRLAIAAGLIVGGLAVGSYTAWSLTSDHYKGLIAIEEAKRSAVVIQAMQDQAAQVVAQAKISDGVTDDFEKQIADIDARYGSELERVRQQAADAVRAGSLPSFPEAPSIANGSACADKVPARNRSASLAARREAERNTAKLVGLQKWIREQEALSAR